MDLVVHWYCSRIFSRTGQAGARVAGRDLFEGVLARYKQRNIHVPEGEEDVHIRAVLWEYLDEHADEVRGKLAALGTRSEHGQGRQGPARPA